MVCLLRLASERKLLPMIVFSFARKECETFAMMSWTAGEKGKDLDFTTADEKEAISEVRLSGWPLASVCLPVFPENCLVCVPRKIHE